VPLRFQRVLHRQRVHDRCQHAHVIGGGAVEALVGRGQPAKDIAAAHDEAELVTRRLGRAISPAMRAVVAGSMPN
jgi:hypothetical protein